MNEDVTCDMSWVVKMEKDISGYLWQQSTYQIEREVLAYCYRPVVLYERECWTL